MWFINSMALMKIIIQLRKQEGGEIPSQKGHLQPKGLGKTELEEKSLHESACAYIYI